jgi:hypothetical protein
MAGEDSRLAAVDSRMVAVDPSMAVEVEGPMVAVIVDLFMPGIWLEADRAVVPGLRPCQGSRIDVSQVVI